MGSLSLSLQIVMISTGILSLALVCKVSVPLVINFSVQQAPSLWSSLCSWLKPPYLYVILNCIIITIAASSRFHHSHGDNNKDHHQEVPPAPKISLPEPDHHFPYEIKVSTAEYYGGLPVEEEVVYEQREVEKVSADVFEDKSTVTANGSLEVVEDKDEDFVISKSTWVPSKRIDPSESQPELLIPAEKPLISARFGHRKPVKASPEGGRALRVAKPKRQETLENTWKMITEGRPMPLTRHLKKSDTFDYHGRPVCEADSRLAKKSETLKDRTNYQLPPGSNGNSPASSGGKLRKEPSLSQDELNRRVEAFIKKFNDEMRMQRQESLNQYKEMINRGSH
ncbi:uncharacterized protein LOC8281755 [Ricinus communis]|uniref:DUF4408 domain-containing protein n=1 Tax=Ricinus communis TaxID=3988 RepID=B9S612_RICCO|nr:uncharacterized protein LOC8281755 [Ricinus communis]EEF40921.1 conserved hypothetical protein [Ricinus communis]|eukprot:XP_002521431.1 uncharacterized protein LOC8281755 [Ricinus communis]